MTDTEGAVVEAPTLPTPALPSDAVELLDSILKHRGWDLREGQHKMVEFIDRSIKKATPGRNIDITTNAPVGTGKTLAYLVAGLARGERIVIATSTKSLQDQIVCEELPQLREDLLSIYGYDLTYGVLKGKSNYACLDHATRLVGDDTDTEDELFSDLGSIANEDIERVKVMIAQTREFQEIGDIAHFDAEWFWGTVSSTTARPLRASHRCPTRNAAWVNKDDLPEEDIEGIDVDWERRRNFAIEAAHGFDIYRAAYAHCMTAQVVVVNTSLLVAEIKKGGMFKFAPDQPRLLEGVGMVVVDEAHHLGKILADAYSHDFSFGHVMETVTDFVKKMRKRYEKDPLICGSILGLPDLLQATSDLIYDAEVDHDERCDDYERWDSAARAASEVQMREDIRKALLIMVSQFQRDLPVFMDRAAGFHSKNPSDIKLSRRGIPTTVQGMIGEMYDDVVADASDLAAEVVSRFKVSDEGGEEKTILTNDLSLLDDEQGEVVTMKTVPLDISRFRGDIAAMMRQENFYVGPPGGHESSIVLLCSGTITENTPKLVGMDPFNYTDVPTPFDSRRAALCIPTNLPQPNDYEWPDKAWRAARKAIQKAGGRTLFLTTSNRNLAVFTERARKDLGVSVFSQVDGLSKRELVQKFKDDDTSVLLGTIGFWEGVDVPGDSCVLVIMDKMPFPMKDDPIFEARRKYFSSIDSASNAAFMHVDVDHASKMLAQGAGRLIRSVKDLGGVMILDPRTRTARYSGKVLGLLPGDWKITTSLSPFLDWLKWANPDTRKGNKPPKLEFPDWTLLRPPHSPRAGRRLRGRDS